MFSHRNKEKDLHKIEFNSQRINWGSNMAVVSLFRGSNMSAVTSGENQELFTTNETFFIVSKRCDFIRQNNFQHVSERSTFLNGCPSNLLFRNIGRGL